MTGAIRPCTSTPIFGEESFPSSSSLLLPDRDLDDAEKGERGIRAAFCPHFRSARAALTPAAAGNGNSN